MGEFKNNTAKRFNKAAQEARDSQVGQLLTKGYGIARTMQITGQSYARVQAIKTLMES